MPTGIYKRKELQPLDEQATKQQVSSRTKYVEKREQYLQRSRERAIAEREDRRLSAAGDAEAAARCQRLRDMENTRHWATGRCLPMAEHRAIQVAVAYVLAPLRKQERLSADKRYRTKQRQELLLGLLNADPVAMAKKAKLDQQNRNKQAAWQDRTIARAHAGDPTAAHELWKKTVTGMEWRSHQIGMGLGTSHVDKKNALPTI